MTYACIPIRPDNWENAEGHLNRYERDGFTLVNIVQPAEVLDRNHASLGSIAMLIMHKRDEQYYLGSQGTKETKERKE